MGEGRTVIGLDAGWKFRKAGAGAVAGAVAGAATPSHKGFDDSAWQTVALPHDWSVTEPFSPDYSSGTGYAAGGIGWYRKSFRLDAEYAGKLASITFDGVYNNSQVWINGHNLGRRPNGYSSFSYDLTPFLVSGGGTNVVVVKVSRLDLADSRWFTGSGIYRSVYLTLTDPVRLAAYSPFVVIPAASAADAAGADAAAASAAALMVEARVINSTDRAVDAVVRHSLADPRGTVAATYEASLRLGPGADAPCRAALSVARPELWSPDSPSLYALTTEVVADGKTTDRTTTAVGIRTFRFDPDRGFFLNDANLKLKGVCLHHDAGCLGAAVPAPVWADRLAKLKAMGCNAIRMSHNPPDPKLLDLCDSLGFLVIDEAFDEWEGVKNKWSTGHNVYPPKHFGYGDDFPVWHEADLAAMVQRDRNHPSIILWSVGNEVDYPNDPYCHPSFLAMAGNNDAGKPAQEMMYDPDKPNAERLAGIARELVAIVKKHDATRPVTAAIAFPELSNITGYCAELDVVGYNYKENFYAADHAAYPDRALLGSENGAGYDQWLAARDTDFIAGQFVWTGVDYLGEAKGWPVRASPAGFLDLAGNPKPKYFFRKSLWSAEPVLCLAVRPNGEGAGAASEWSKVQAEAAHWDWGAGEAVEVVAYTNLPEVELILNGRSLGTRRLDDAPTGYLHWDLAFEPGRLEARAADSPISCELRTSGAAAAVVVLAAPAAITADGRYVARIDLGLADATGIPIATADVPVAVRVEGPGELLGLESGDVADTEAYTTPFRKTYRGRLVAYVRSTGVAGTVRLRAESAGLEAAAATIDCR